MSGATRCWGSRRAPRSSGDIESFNTLPLPSRRRNRHSARGTLLKQETIQRLLIGAYDGKIGRCSTFCVLTLVSLAIPSSTYHITIQVAIWTIAKRASAIRGRKKGNHHDGNDCDGPRGTCLVSLIRDCLNKFTVKYKL